MPSESEHVSLMGIGLTCTRLWNELNYKKRQAFFNRELTRKGTVKLTASATINTMRF
ncbi:MAG: hypothetical protein RQ885_01390 [Desulfurococcales archaeon]|jgi:hypothetical protein|nr:hypothetical protein [Desulfurococcales archaeon]